MNTKEAWIETFTGVQFNLLDPTPEQVCIEDIAHALSNQCRYTGHTRKFYSVAEHSYYCSLLVPSEEKLSALLHDASEAYVTDLSRPIKHCTPVGPPYLELEDRIMRAIAAKFGTVWPVSPNVKEADNTMLWTEKGQLMGGVSWAGSTIAGEMSKTLGVQLGCYLPEVMEGMFLNRYVELTSSVLLEQD